MLKSFSEITEFKCPQCQKPIQAAVWLIVDIHERPDLIERIQNHSIHDIYCRSCSYEGMADAPLLVHLPDQKQVLLASPQGTSEEEDRQIAASLLGKLASTFPVMPEYLKNARMVPPEMLGQLILLEDPLEAMDELDKAHNAMEAAVASLSEENQAAMEKILKNASTPEEFAEALEKHPKLKEALAQTPKDYKP